jgi:hypothetical protein
MTTATQLTARQKLDLSTLKLTQKELMGDDIDINHINLQIKNVFGVDIAGAITAGSIERTIEGASTLNLDVFDRDRKLLRSGRLAARTDVRIDGLWFRLAAVNKESDTLSLTFEDREIAILRTYFSIIKASAATARQRTTRAEFILRMIREVKEFRIPWVIPELDVVQPIEEDQQTKQPLGGNDQNAIKRGKGIPHGAGEDSFPDKARQHQYSSRVIPGLRVKGERMTNYQIDCTNAVLNAAASMGCTRPELVMTVMCGITESRLQNLRGGDRDSVGFFQQRASQGWPASRNLARDTKAFITALKTYEGRHPHFDYNDLIQGVQNSGTPNAYGPHRNEAERIVTAYGESADFANDNAMQSFGGTAADYEFYRGVPPALGLHNWGRENSWTCIQRLASEVNLRAFFVSGTFYYISEIDLMKSKPAAIISEDTKGVEDISGNYDTGKTGSDLRVTARMGRWAAPPGSVIQIKEMGPWNGRWLVANVQRSLFDSLGTITLKKARPTWPEPIGDTAGQKRAQQTSSPYTMAPTPSIPDSPGGDAAHAAKLLLAYHNQGKYRDDNGQQIEQLKKIAAGQKLKNQCGNHVSMNSFVLNGLIQLIEAGLWVGTFALCEDHSCNEGQHPKGQAADISSLGSPLTGWHALNASSQVATGLAKQAMKILGPTSWDLICNGIGRYDSSVQALQRDNGHVRGGIWETDHTNHIHYGVSPGRAPEDRS